MIVAIYLGKGLFMKKGYLAWILLSLISCDAEVIFKDRSITLKVDECIGALDIKAQSNACSKAAFEGTDQLPGCLWLKTDQNTYALAVSLNQDESLNLGQSSLLSNIDFSAQNINAAFAFYENTPSCDQINADDICNGNQCLFYQPFKALELDFDQGFSVLKACTWQYQTVSEAKAEISCDDIDNDCDGKIDESNAMQVGANCQIGIGACQSTGKYACSAIGTEPKCDAQTIEPSAEICDGLDNDCDGEIDNALTLNGMPIVLNDPCVLGKGICQTTGTYQCRENMVVCNAQEITPMVEDNSNCNGVDDDCDGFTDESFGSTGMQNIQCGIGACQQTGRISCVNGSQVSSCFEGEPQEKDDNCNGVDEDCNGNVDEDFIIDVTSCGTGNCVNSGILSCQRGAPNSTCQPRMAGANDFNCDGLDEDCDGIIDEDFSLMDTTIRCGIGVCVNETQSQCIGGRVIADCQPNQATGPDLCDGLDNDCDGRTDEGHQNALIECGLGSCKSIGYSLCIEGQLNDTCEASQPVTNVDNCDGLDNDCDGRTDESFVDANITCGFGICNRPGTTSCQQGMIVTNCTSGAPQAEDLESACNGVDEDCDGRVDERYILTTVTCGLGACSQIGFKSCVNGVEQNSCRENAVSSSDANCNGVDDDCNGRVDEDYVSSTIFCGQGICRVQGSKQCVNGSEQQICNPLTPIVGEIDSSCDGVNQDCDNATDEGFSSSVISCGAGVCALSISSRCEQGVLIQACTPGQPIGNDTNCNGIDDDCDGAVDDGYSIQNTDCGIGVCKSFGKKVCISGSEQSLCVPNPPLSNADNTCNGLDDNCNGMTDENFAGSMISCGVGACANTITQTCITGVLNSTCIPKNPMSASDTTCNNIDDDCDGKVDESYVAQSTACAPGSCTATAPQICVAGAIVNTCTSNANNNPDNQCDGIDNDCDMKVDESYVPLAISCGVGICQNMGSVRCTNGSLFSDCTPLAAAQSELCNGLDDTCNGTIDENYSRALTCGVGACAKSGVATCVNGSEQVACTPNTPSTELCGDTIDNDCDTRTDEGFNVNSSCTVGVGACVRMGSYQCSADKISTFCQGTAGAPGVESCNGIDDDCDGKTDELLNQPISCGVGVCLNSGEKVCTGGVFVDQCTPKPQASPTELCNNLDDNCNGSIDENISSPTSCGVGECINSSTITCVSGQLVNNCSPKAASSEICDSKDNDCDGTVDNGFAGFADNNCNGVDENCNGTKDEGYVGSAVSCGVGACVNQGTTICSNGNVQNQCTPLNPGTEKCGDSIDNDCDTRTDEGFASIGLSCTVGVGECLRTGTFVCGVDGTVVCNATPGNPVNELCDGKDNNCNGSTDETFSSLNASCSVGTGACARSGLNVCKADGSGVSCNATAGSPSAELCNGIDDNCDGTIDNSPTDINTFCADTTSTNYCVKNSKWICQMGVRVCQPATAVVETCNGIDDNCDNTIDNVQGVGQLCGDMASSNYCIKNSTRQCVNNQLTCVQASPLAANENNYICDANGRLANRLDEDCDGRVDEYTKMDGTRFYTYKLGDNGCSSSKCVKCSNGSINLMCVNSNSQCY